MPARSSAPPDSLDGKTSSLRSMWIPRAAPQRSHTFTLRELGKGDPHPSQFLAGSLVGLSQLTPTRRSTSQVDRTRLAPASISTRLSRVMRLSASSRTRLALPSRSTRARWVAICFSASSWAAL